MIPGQLLIRADSGLAIGSGHVMRSLALAQEWTSSGGSVTFLKTAGDAAVDQRLLREGTMVEHLVARVAGEEDAAETIRHARRIGARWVVVDGYHFSRSYQLLLRAAGLHLLHIDDAMSGEEYCADVVLDQNIYAHEALYGNRAPWTQLLLGTDYVLLRREFLQHGSEMDQLPRDLPHLLVTLGGSDPENVTLLVIEALLKIPSERFTATVVVGGANPHLAELAGMTQTAQHIELLSNVTDMPSLMRQADVAISGGGSTIWELCYMGVPSIVLVLADNQEKIAAELDGRGAALSAGRYTMLDADTLAAKIERLLGDPVRRRQLVETARQVVDGRGVERVIACLHNYQ